MDTIIITKAPTTSRAIHCPICGMELHPPTRHSCGQDILEDLSAIADYLREQAGGTIQPVQDYTRDYARAVQEDACQCGSYADYSRNYDALTGAKGGVR